MADIFGIALQNLLAPMVLFFALGVGAALLRSDLEVPEAFAKALALYLMLAIGFKGGAALAEQGVDVETALALVAGIVLSFVLPLLAFAFLRSTTQLRAADAAAVAAHYGSISVVTFVTATEFLGQIEVEFNGYMVAVLAIMETPAIVSGLWLAYRFAASLERRSARSQRRAARGSQLVREIFFNGSVVLLVGALLIGWVSGPKGFETMAPFIDAPFKGVLALFLLDMGLVAARRMRDAKGLTPSLVLFGFYMPMISAVVGVGVGAGIGLGVAETALLGVLCASASYIAVPAAMRLALPEANPGIYITMSLAVTFPFNIVIGIPVYYAMAQWAVAP